MASQTIQRNINAQIALQGFFCKDAAGNPAQGVSTKLNVVSGDVSGVTMSGNQGLGYTIACVKTGTYQINVTSTNAGGSITTNASGDVGGTDTVTVIEPAPASQGWSYA